MKWRSIIFHWAMLLSLTALQGYSQVWNGDLIFSNQTDIDNFATTSYTSVNGNLYIEDARDGQHDIRNLAGLAGLTSVNGFFYIINNNLLTNTVYLNLVSVRGASILSNAVLTTINGLPLTSIALGLTIENNASLTSITAFSSLTTIGTQLIIQSNPMLTNVSGFANLETVTGSVILGYNNSMTNLNSFMHLTECNALSVRFNPVLTNVNGLIGLKRVTQLNIFNNSMLTNIDGLAGLTTVTFSIEIANNPLIQNIAGLSNLNTINTVFINIHHNNALGVINGPNQPRRIGLLRIEQNPALLSISGFSGATYMSGIEIISNRALQTISAFKEVDTIEGNFVLQQSNVLTTINGFSKLAFISGNYQSVSNYDLANITPMPFLDSIGGEFRFVFDTMLLNLDHISNLRSVRRGFMISSCIQLSNINGLSKLRSVAGNFTFSNCPQISSLNVLSLDTADVESLFIGGMAKLQNLAGLNKIYRVETDLTIVGCPQLTNINDLINLDSVGRDLVIAINPLLPNLDGLYNVRKAYFVNIQNNTALAEYCGLYKLYAGGGPTFATTIIQNLVNPTAQQILNGGPCANVPLPVALKVFNLRCENSQVMLHWITSNELNNSHFVLQKSVDGNTWTDVGSIPAARGNAGEHKYFFTDNTRLPDEFYRLAQFDLDGRVQYSSVLKSRCNIQSEFALWPNPATSKVVINIPSSSSSMALIRILDSKGVVMKSKSLVLLPGLNQFEIDIAGFAKGMYMLQLVNETGTLQKNKMFLKQ